MAMAKTDAEHDVLVLGGGPAGCAAAIAAARRQLRTLLIERQATDRRTCPGWIGPAAARQCAACGVDLKELATQFTGLRLWSWDWRKHSDVHDRELSGWLINGRRLEQALLAAARTAGARLLCPATAVDVQLAEHAAHVTLTDGQRLSAQVVIIADGAASLARRLARLPEIPSDECGAAWTELDCPDAGAALEVVLGTGRTPRVATLARGLGKLRITLLTGEMDAPATKELAALVTAGRAAGALPPGPPVAVHPAVALAGVALDLETHVGKRCLLVGEAGGFVTALSNEGLYPALRSGWLAGEKAAAALAAPLLQDELATFSADWRADLADYMRMPNTDLGLLLPMVFSNRQIALRLARSFLLGQPF